MSFELRNRAGERLDHVFTPGHADGPELVLVAHGVTSHHDRPYLVELCEALQRAGLASLRFSYSGNGASEGRYEDLTIRKEVDDLGSVLDGFPDRVLAYVGHSMGAAVGVLRAAQDPRIRALVSLAGMVRVRAFAERHFQGLVPGRDVMFGRPQCPLTQHFLDEAQRIDTTLAAASAVAVPWLLVHGDSDELVPLADSEAAKAVAAGRAELRVMPGADHRFQNRHGELARMVVPWLVATLGRMRAGH